MYKPVFMEDRFWCDCSDEWFKTNWYLHTTRLSGSLSVA